ncbi:hypothetical protein [Mucisphaera calidilacus]|uniref:Uncharacterized protein n=1 Tax=Mucisphaera calidilacus TaxID=2527982 RepID=A0A518BWX5_9BACT|nr:hypothetical protein [Mucisphaera calidilacus]QDU71479.1 hypothetical protein Pan265_13290 [Mucisphaera calidilacus]
MSNEVQEHVGFAALEEAFDALYVWLARLYDTRTGGFYYQLSSLESPDLYRPDLESTGQAIRIMSRAELLPVFGTERQRATASFLNQHQHSDGYFRAKDGDPHANPERMLGRYLDYCRIGLDLLGSKPRYALPTEFSGELKNEALEPEMLEQWIEARDWSNPWQALDQVSSRAQILDNMNSDAAGRAIANMIDLVIQRQDRETGLWGSGEPYVMISGAFKAIYLLAGRCPFPKADAVYGSLMECVREHPAPRVTWISNAINLFLAVEPHMSYSPPDSDREDLLRISTRNLLTCLRDDGGFSITSEGSWAAPNEGIVLGRGLVEGDMNSAGLASQVWLNLRHVMRVPSRPPRGADRFAEALAPTPRVVIKPAGTLSLGSGNTSKA